MLDESLVLVIYVAIDFLDDGVHKLRCVWLLERLVIMGRDHVVKGHALPRLGCNKDLVSSLGLFAPPRCFRHGPKEAACALGRRHLGKATRDLTILGKDLEFWEGEVAKAVMPLHQLGLIVGGGELKFLVFLERRRGVEGEGAAASNAWMRLVVGRRRR